MGCLQARHPHHPSDLTPNLHSCETKTEPLDANELKDRYQPG